MPVDGMYTIDLRSILRRGERHKVREHRRSGGHMRVLCGYRDACGVRSVWMGRSDSAPFGSPHPLERLARLIELLVVVEVGRRGWQRACASAGMATTGGAQTIGRGLGRGCECPGACGVPMREQGMMLTSSRGARMGRRALAPGWTALLWRFRNGRAGVNAACPIVYLGSSSAEIAKSFSGRLRCDLRLGP